MMKVGFFSRKEGVVCMDTEKCTSTETHHTTRERFASIVVDVTNDDDDCVLLAIYYSNE